MRHDTSIAAIRLICRIAIGVSTGLFAAATFGADRSGLATSRHLSLRAAFDTIQSNDLRKHAVYLADDTFEGREAGSRGGRLLCLGRRSFRIPTPETIHEAHFLLRAPRAPSFRALSEPRSAQLPTHSSVGRSAGSISNPRRVPASPARRLRTGSR